MDEIGAVMEFVQEQADNIDIDVVMGACDDPSIGEKLTVTLIATGFETKQEIGFSQVVEKVVHQLNDKIETTTVAQTVAPVNNVVAEVTLAEVDNVVLDTVNDELDFFAPIDITSEEANEFSVEFNVSRDEQKLLETFEAAATTQEIVEEQPIILAEQNVVEEEIITYHKRSYETETIQAYKTEELNKDLEDRKRVLAGLSYRVGNKQNLSDLENEPAYKRKGLDVNSDSEYSTQNEVSRYSVGNDAFDRPEIKKNNTYLHDNVD
jgi:cell division protein FtsZ